ncbi:serine hydrolase domain-containing protein [Maricaulis salignorans]|uniref:serine hydrolase domain-containing protein n=1 Tax=Maricaulis salignorans TaxID=144026 RepID=UPI003A93CDCD
MGISFRAGVLGLSLGLMTAACSEPAETEAAPAAETVLPAATEAALNARLDAMMDVYAPVGYSVAIFRGEQLVFERHDGLERLGRPDVPTEHTLYAVFSMSKLFFLVAVMQSVERGELDLDAPIGQYVTDLPEAWRTLRVRELLEHVSGLPEYYFHPNVPANAQDAMALVRNADFLNPTGDVSRYNQTNFLLVLKALETVSGRSYADLVGIDQIARLGLDDSIFGGRALADQDRIVLYRGQGADGGLLASEFPVYPPYVHSSVGLNTSLADLKAWTRALVQGELVARQTLLDHWQPMPLNSGRPGAYATGWEYQSLGEFTSVGHGGGGRVNLMHAFRTGAPDDNVTVIYLDNGGPRETSQRRLTAALANEIVPGIATGLQILFEDLTPVYSAQGWPAVLERLDRYADAEGLDDAGREGLLNSFGYNLFNVYGPASAQDPFRTNVERYASSPNVHDSLGEAVWASGDPFTALGHYQAALSLDPGNRRIESVIAALEREIDAATALSPGAE